MTDLKAAMQAVNGMAGITMQDSGKRYTTVAQRTEALRSVTNDTYGIETEIIFYPGSQNNNAQPNTIVMRAIVRHKDGRIIGTGHAEETRGANWINETSALEACETSAIGRALASMGLHGGEFASINEIETAQGKRAANATSGAQSAVTNTTKSQISLAPMATSTSSVGTTQQTGFPGTTTAVIAPNLATSGGWQTAVEAFRQFAKECQNPKALGEFWAANRHVIDDMKAKAPVFYAEAKDIFSARDAALSRSQGPGL